MNSNWIRLTTTCLAAVFVLGLTGCDASIPPGSRSDPSANGLENPSGESSGLRIKVGDGVDVKVGNGVDVKVGDGVDVKAGKEGVDVKAGDGVDVRLKRGEEDADQP